MLVTLLVLLVLIFVFPDAMIALIQAAVFIGAVVIALIAIAMGLGWLAGVL